jgi:hypothetical protein
MGQAAQITARYHKGNGYELKSIWRVNKASSRMWMLQSSKEK